MVMKFMTLNKAYDKKSKNPRVDEDEDTKKVLELKVLVCKVILHLDNLQPKISLTEI